MPVLQTSSYNLHKNKNYYSPPQSNKNYHKKISEKRQGNNVNQRILTRQKSKSSSASVSTIKGYDDNASANSEESDIVKHTKNYYNDNLTGNKQQNLAQINDKNNFNQNEIQMSNNTEFLNVIDNKSLNDNSLTQDQFGLITTDEETDYEAQLVATGRHYDSRSMSIIYNNNDNQFENSSVSAFNSTSYNFDIKNNIENESHTTPTPTYEEYQQTPTKYTIAHNNSVSSINCSEQNKNNLKNNEFSCIQSNSMDKKIINDLYYSDIDSHSNCTNNYNNNSFIDETIQNCSLPQSQHYIK